MSIKAFENKVWLSTPTMHGEELKYVQEAYDSNWMSTVGENINEVERQLSEPFMIHQGMGKKQAAQKALEMLDRGLEVLPSPKIRYSDANTYPFIEGYYSLEEWEKGDELLQNYLQTLIEYIEYYLQFDGMQATLVGDIIQDKMDSLMELYYLAAYAQRAEIVGAMNDYLRTFGYTDEELIQPGTEPAEMIDASTIDME